MDIFAKNKIAVVTIALLITINLFTLSIVWFGGNDVLNPPRMEPPPENADRVAFLLKNDLDLTDAQVRAYHKLRMQHQEKIRLIDEDIYRLKRELLLRLFSDQFESQESNQLFHAIGEQQKLAERATVTHFMEMKKLCGERQREKLHRLLDEFFQYHQPQRPAGDEKNPRLPPPSRGVPDAQF
ncbi:periplasmic heavy metal sensor [candidate division KSB1 bacterium]|nr:periplasmic heavy metal sensor [candidate division KSB1 bacterium]